MLVLKILILAMLIAVFIQDIKSRSVYWVSFPLLAVALSVLNFREHGKAGIVPTVFINLLLLAGQLLLISIYFSLKKGRWINITGNLLGWGDILFLISIAFYLSVLNFLFFYVSSLIIVLSVWLIWQLVEKNKKIPLAGLQALFFAVFLASDWWLGLIDLTSDDWLLKLIIK